MLVDAIGNTVVTRLDVSAGFFLSAAQAPERDCAIALDTSRKVKAAQIDKIFSI
jgi:hypothetical protein